MDGRSAAHDGPGPVGDGGDWSWPGRWHWPAWPSSVWSGPALAKGASGADLSLKVTAKASPTSDTTALSYTVKNAGPAVATNVTVTTLVNAPNFSSIVIAASSQAASCGFISPPTGFNTAFTCTIPSLAKAGTWTFSGPMVGSAAGGLTMQSQVTDNPSVPDPKPGNNSATTISSFGPQADLVVTQAAAPGSTTGHATVVITITNNGPQAASGISLSAAVLSPTFTTGSFPGEPQTTTCVQGTTPPGFTLGYGCSFTGTLAKGKSVSVTLDAQGTSGGALRQDVAVKSTTTDLQPNNNSSTVDTTFK